MRNVARIAQRTYVARREREKPSTVITLMRMANRKHLARISTLNSSAQRQRRMSSEEFRHVPCTLFRL